MSKNSHSELHYRMSGKGHPVVFLHGFLESMTMWDYLPLHELNCCVICVDLPGHGKSPLPDAEQPHMRGYAESVEELLVQLGIESYSVVGHSMGGYVALELMNTELAPEQVVLLNSNFWTDSPAKMKDRVRVADVLLKAKSLFLREAIPNLFKDAAHHRLEVEQLISEADQLAPEGYAFASLAMRARRDTEATVRAHSKQVLILQGAEDTIVPADTMTKKCTDWIRPVVIRDAGHMAHIEQSGKVLEELKSFLKRG